MKLSTSKAGWLTIFGLMLSLATWQVQADEPVLARGLPFFGSARAGVNFAFADADQEEAKQGDAEKEHADKDQGPRGRRGGEFGRRGDGPPRGERGQRGEGRPPQWAGKRGDAAKCPACDGKGCEACKGKEKSGHGRRGMQHRGMGHGHHRGMGHRGMGQGGPGSHEMRMVMMLFGDEPMSGHGQRGGHGMKGHHRGHHGFGGHGMKGHGPRMAMRGHGDKGEHHAHKKGDDHKHADKDHGDHDHADKDHGDHKHADHKEGHRGMAGRGHGKQGHPMRGRMMGRRGFGGKGGFFGGPQSDEVRKLMAGNIGRMMVLQSELNITDEQKTQLKEVMKKNHEGLQANMKAVGEARKEVYKTAISGGDEAAIREAASALTDKIAESAIAMAKMRTEAQAIFTDEQQTKIKEVIAANKPAREQVRTLMEEKRAEMKKKFEEMKQKREAEQQKKDAPADETRDDSQA